MTAKHCAKETRQKTVNQLSCHWSTVASWHDWQQSLTAFLFLILIIQESQSQWLMAAYNDRIIIHCRNYIRPHTMATEFSPGVRHSMKTPCCMHSHNMGRSKSPRLQTTAKFSYPDPAGHAIVCQPGSWICHCQRLHSNMLSSASATAASTSSGDTSPGAASPSGAAAGIGSAPAAGSLKSDLEE